MATPEENSGMRNFASNQPDPVMVDESDNLMEFENFLNSETDFSASPSVETPAGNEPAEIDFEGPNEPQNESNGNSTENENETDINFEDELVTEKNEIKPEDAIKLLESQGYKVEREGNLDPLKQKEHEINQIDTVINNLKNALQADDIVLCREKVVDDLIRKYKSSGRENLINSEEFKLEVEAGMEEFQYNERLVSLQAAQVRSDIQAFINDRTNLKNKISAEVREARDKEIQENRKALQEEFKKYNGQVLFGQRLEQKDLVNAYKTLVSGDFASKIEKDKSLQAEFALFLELKPKLAGQSGSGTYGEGVAAAVNALNGGTQKVTESSLAKTVSRPGAGGVLNDRLSRWKQLGEVKETGK